MAKYNYAQDVYLVSTGEKTRVKSVITDLKKTSYLLDNGMSVVDSDITDKAPEKPKRKRVKEIKKEE